MLTRPSTSLLGLNLQELEALATESGQPAYRGQQLFDAVYRQKIERLDQASTLPLDYRARLMAEGWGVGIPEITRKFVSTDGTVRYLIGLADGETVETVWMPEGDGGERGDGTEAGDEIETERVVAGLGLAGRGPSAPLRAESARSAPLSESSGHDLRIEPGGMRGELQVLFYGAARGQAKSGGGRNRRADRGGAPRAGS